MSVISVDPQAVRLKRRLRAHFRTLGFGRNPDGSLQPPDSGKDTYRALHDAQRREKLKRNAGFVKANSAELIRYFANGTDIRPDRVEPVLEEVKAETLEGRLFRFAALQWRIPVSDGYGRRMRFLVRDKSNDKLIGLIALGDAVFNLRARDEFVGWDHRQRMKKLASVMDAYVLGAVPPYNQLLGGKLVASLIRTEEVESAFRKRYGDSKGIISGVKKKPRLVMATTTSALGRSSVYNRLRLGDQPYFESVGYTGGWGHFHVSDSLFDEIREFLVQRGDSYASDHGYGNGPNWKMRAIRKAFRLLGLNEEVARHRLSREVFVCELATNAKAFLRGEQQQARFGGQLLSVGEVGQKALARWIVPRAQRRPEFAVWQRENVLADMYDRQLAEVSRHVGSNR